MPGRRVASAPASHAAAVSQVAVTCAKAAVSIACSSVWATGTAAVPRWKETSDTAAVSLGTSMHKNIVSKLVAYNQFSYSFMLLWVDVPWRLTA